MTRKSSNDDNLLMSFTSQRKSYKRDQTLAGQKQLPRILFSRDGTNGFGTQRTGDTAIT